MRLFGLRDEEGREVELVISDEGHPHHHVLSVYATSAPEGKHRKFEAGDWVTFWGAYGNKTKQIEDIDNDPVYPINFVGGGAWELDKNIRFATQDEINEASRQKKPLPKTKEEFKSSLIKFGIDFSENITREDVEEFLENYED
jgi:hypothetical protein